MYNDLFRSEFFWKVVYSITTKEGIIRSIQDNNISTDPNFRKPFKSFKYNVFNEKQIYEEFSNININDLSSIDDFVNRRGILGLHIEQNSENLQDTIHEYEQIEKQAIEERNLKIIEKHYQIRKMMGEINEAVYIEKIDDFIREVKLMRNVLTLNSFETIKVSEIEKVKIITKEIEDLANIDFEVKFPIEMKKAEPDFKLLEHKTKALISAVIGIKMKNVERRLGLISEKNKSYRYIDTWVPKSLLGCMYTMLYNDLSQGCRTSICNVCDYPLVIRDSRDKQYHASCRGSNNTANTRKRQAKQAENYIIKKYSNKNLSIDDIFEIEKDYIFSKIGKSTPFNKKRIKEWLNRK